jgi:hypothetical protein
MLILVGESRTAMKHKKKVTKQQKKSQSERIVKREKRITSPKTAEQLFALPEQTQETWNRVLQVVSKMRISEVSLQQAAREVGVDPRTVSRLAKTALRKRTNGRYAAKASDRLLRVLVIPTKDGLREVAVRDSKAASRIGAYSDAVQKYLQTGESSALRKFRREHFKDAAGKKFRLLTDLKHLEHLGSAGVLSFESLYARSA